MPFTREEDLEAAAAFLPDRPISPHPNLVTVTGLEQLDRALDAARVAYATAQSGGDIKADRGAIAEAARDLRYLGARRASAQLTQPGLVAGLVQFGSRATFKRADGRHQTFRIVGEDEADPASGSVSYVSPLARALLGKHVGETGNLLGSEVEIVAVD